MTQEYTPSMRDIEHSHVYGNLPEGNVTRDVYESSKKRLEAEYVRAIARHDDQIRAEAKAECLARSEKAMGEVIDERDGLEHRISSLVENYAGAAAAEWSSASDPIDNMREWLENQIRQHKHQTETKTTTALPDGLTRRLEAAGAGLGTAIMQAYIKHGDMSIAVLPADHPDWLKILVEEVGEAAHETTYDVQPNPQHLAAELHQVAAVAACWAAAIQETHQKQTALAEGDES